MNLAGFCSRAGQFESHLVGNPEDRFSCDGVHVMLWDCANRKDTNCPAQLQLLESLQIFGHSTQRYHTIQAANIISTGKTAILCKLICDFVVRICHDGAQT